MSKIIPRASGGDRVPTPGGGTCGKDGRWWLWARDNPRHSGDECLGLSSTPSSISPLLPHNVRGGGAVTGRRPAVPELVGELVEDDCQIVPTVDTPRHRLIGLELGEWQDVRVRESVSIALLAGWMDRTRHES
jgi:hypothetical protein